MEIEECAWMRKYRSSVSPYFPALSFEKLLTAALLEGELSINVSNKTSDRTQMCHLSHFRQVVFERPWYLDSPDWRLLTFERRPVLRWELMTITAIEIRQRCLAFYRITTNTEFRAGMIFKNYRLLYIIIIISKICTHMLDILSDSGT